MTRVTRTEHIWLTPTNSLSHMCHLSKNLYNEANYAIKQSLKAQGTWIRYTQLYHQLKLSTNYQQLPAQTGQQILRLLDSAWNSFFKAIKEWKRHPEKFKKKPRPPKYKKKNGEHLLVFTNQQCRIKNNVLLFPKKLNFACDITTRLADTTDLREVRILPKGVGYACEIVYQKVIAPKAPDKRRIAGIDLGVSNIITMVNNIGKKPIVVKDDGRGIKSINQFYQKEKARLQSIYDRQEIQDGTKMKKLRVTYDRKSKDYLHKLSRSLINWCVQHRIGKLVIGYNPEWKQQVDLGKWNNQTFVLIPYMKLINMIQYKTEEQGIAVELVEESHTSKCSFLDNETIEHHEQYLGKRVRRGLFRSAQGLLINADVNGACNIVRKSEPNAFTQLKADGVGGCFMGLHPVRWNLLMNDDITRSHLNHMAQIA
ncbi:MAG: RNA-guided endonuclease InsQ/TnpB family protein [Promethearchaeota archaeon]